MKLRKFVAVGVCSMGLGQLGFAADDQPAAKPNPVPSKAQADENRRDEKQQAGQNQGREHALATCLAIENQAEVAIAKFAQEKSGNASVKEFARMLVKDHTAFLQKLQQYAPEATRDGFLMDHASTSETDSRQARDSSAKVQPAGGASRTTDKDIRQTAAVEGGEARHAGNSIDFLALHKEIAQECLSESKEKLGKKNGNEFDECFIGHQIAMHGAMKDKLVVFKRHTSGELAQTIAAGIETTETHMKKAEEIMKQLASGSPSRSKSVTDTSK